jgi:uncharacterized membrane protein YciS (DUF1049 family)
LVGSGHLLALILVLALVTISAVVFTVTVGLQQQQGFSLNCIVSKETPGFKPV